MLIGAAARRMKRITIQTPDETMVSNSSGELTGNWTNVATVYASLEPLSGHEQLLAKAQQDLTTHKIRIAYCDGITSKMRALYNSRTFHFSSVINLAEENRELEIMAIEDRE